MAEQGRQGRQLAAEATEAAATPTGDSQQRDAEAACARDWSRHWQAGAFAARCAAFPPLWADSEMHQPILGLDTAPRPLRLMVCACLDRPWSLLPAEPRVRPLVGHFRLAPKGT